MRRVRRYTESPLYSQPQLPLQEVRRSTASLSAVVCPYCHYVGPLVWVHGHGQCPQCKSVVEECCSGEQASPAWRE